MLKKIIFSLILFVAPLFSPVFMANAAELTKNCFRLTLSLIDKSAETIVYSNGTNWYSDSSCSNGTSLTIPRRASNNALPVYFNTECAAKETSYIANATVTYPTTTVRATCTYSADEGFACNITPDKITSNTVYCADTFASPTDLTSIIAEESSASLTYSASSGTCYAITLNANGGIAAPTSVLYKKTDADGWFTDSSCTTSYGATTDIVPTRSDYTFRGYFSEPLEDATSTVSNGTLYIRYTGASTLAGKFWNPTTDEKIYAAWAKNCTTPANGECKLVIDEGTGAATYNTLCNSGYALSDGGTANPKCTSTSGFWNDGSGGSCGDVVNIYFWGLNSNGNFVNLTESANPTFTNSANPKEKWKTSGGTVVETFNSLGVSIPTISSPITVKGTTYEKGIKPYRAQWVGGTPPETDIPDGIVAETTVCSTNMDTSRDIALDGSLPDITNAITNYATEANYIILYAANCIDPTGATLGSTCSLSTANGGATYSNTCLPGTGNPTFWQEEQTCHKYDEIEMEPGACEL